MLIAMGTPSQIAIQKSRLLYNLVEQLHAPIIWNKRRCDESALARVYVLPMSDVQSPDDCAGLAAHGDGDVLWVEDLWRVVSRVKGHLQKSGISFVNICQAEQFSGESLCSFETDLVAECDGCY